MSLSVAAVHEERFLVSADQVIRFADVTNDRNPIHLDAEFAKGTKFGRPIAHGALLISLVSGILGMRFPGRGTIIVAQTVRFRRPVHVGSAIRIRLEVLSWDEAKNRMVIGIRIEDEQGDVCMVGETSVIPGPTPPDEGDFNVASPA
ncbi:MAG: MaoC family dehydratase [Candidatus Thermoplasmatota archaeon]